MPTVLVTDYTFANLEIEKAILEPLGCTLLAEQCRSVDAILSVVDKVDYILTQFAPVNSNVIGALKNCRLIVRYGIGVDNVDLDAARAKEIAVCNIPDYCIDEVADHTLGLILNATRGLAIHGAKFHDGGWGLAVPLDQMRTLRDLTVGLIGFGRIGREVERRLAAFKARRLVYDPLVDSKTIAAVGAEGVAFEQLLAESDILTLHCPSTPQTRKLINRAAFDKMKPRAILVNVARGDIVETDSMIQALQSGRLSAAMLDVSDPEPPPVDNPLRSMPNVLMTPHIASASAKAVRTLRTTAAETIARRIRGEPLTNVVNGVNL